MNLASWTRKEWKQHKATRQKHITRLVARPLCRTVPMVTGSTNKYHRSSIDDSLCTVTSTSVMSHAHLSYIHSASSLVFSGSIGFRCCGVLRLFCFHNPARPSASFSGTEGRVPGRPLPDIVASCNCIRFDWPGGPPALRAWLITLVAMFGIIIWTGWVCLRAVRCVVNQLSAVQSHPHHQPPSPRTPTTTTTLPVTPTHHLPVRPQLSPQRTHARLCTHAEVVYRRIHTDESRLLYITFLTLSKWRRSYGHQRVQKQNSSDQK